MSEAARRVAKPATPALHGAPRCITAVKDSLLTMKNSLKQASWTFGAYAMLGLLITLLSGCRTYTDSWQPAVVPTGKAWHNERFQQTAIDANSDGRIDRLRFWIGSGAARELHDRDQDGWFDDSVWLAYERERERTPLRTRAPLIPTTGGTGAFPFPR